MFKNQIDSTEANLLFKNVIPQFKVLTEFDVPSNNFGQLKQTDNFIRLF